LTKLQLSNHTIIIGVIALAVLLNFSTFLYAYPQTFEPTYATIARDFSAYYNGEWRLLHNPTQIYHDGALSGDFQIVPPSLPFRYIPSFLLLFSPILLLSYQNAQNAFNIIQFLLIPLLAYFVYKLVKDKNIFLATAVALIVIVNPIILVPSNSYSVAGFLHWRVFSLHVQTVSPMYYCGYLLANAHILQNVMLVGALYFGFAKKPWISAVLFTFGAFDPRGALLVLPLLLWYNRGSIRKFLGGSVVLLVATNLPFFFYNGIGFAFLGSQVDAAVASFMNLYDWIPPFSIAALTLAEIATNLLKRKTGFSLPWGMKAKEQESLKSV
jgi:hypothetical protein